ncbi:MAG: DUF3501 family protein [Candidatus Binatia bacterium]
MRRVTLDDIIGLARYEEMRERFRRRIIDLKKHRRMPVGDRITFVFENFDTVHFQIQEMLRAERIADVDRVRDEIDVYNALLPDPRELSATMLIELPDSAIVREELPKFHGIDRCVRMEVGTARVDAVFEGGRSREDKVSAVQYVRFPLGAVARSFRGGVSARLVIEHPHYRAEAAIDGDVRRSLAADLEGC